MNSEITVSILCTVYNHEKYIRKCLDGILMQKTNFNFEICINDDASTDNSASIIREYEKKYPDIIKAFYQKENQYSKKVRITKTFLLPMASGKYVALCEGDDFWTDPLKLQKQIDALESNPSCALCVCGTDIVKEDGTPTGRSYPVSKIKSGVIKTEEFLDIIKIYNFHTSGFVFRKDFFEQYHSTDLPFKKVIRVGDEPLLLYFGYIGDVYYVGDKMSAYRTNSVSSWSRNVRSDSTNALNHYNDMIKMVEAFDEFSNKKYHDICLKRVSRINFNISVLTKNYDEVFNKENKQFYKSLSSKSKIKLQFNRFAPGLLSFFVHFYRKVSGR